MPERLAPLAPYLGGKFRLSKRIINKIEQIQHKIYAEPFVGMGGIFLRRTQIPKAEIINDINGELVNLYRIVRRYPNTLYKETEFMFASRQEFERLLKTQPETLTDIERAARFLYLQNQAFGGKVTGQSFGVSIDRPARFDFVKLNDRIRAVGERLASVTIERQDFETFIKRYDTKDTLFYLDPPYWGNETDYGKGVFTRADFERLRDCLTGIKGRFILSLNDTPQVKELFKNFTIEQTDVTYSISKTGCCNRSELII
ncbi:MAG: DNA adenine methylase, partial [Alphaproteobacteria bacterium]|nr:DNA adenine methylase [Alphaproteobacteria bacterium]